MREGKVLVNLAFVWFSENLLFRSRKTWMSSHWHLHNHDLWRVFEQRTQNHQWVLSSFYALTSDWFILTNGKTAHAALRFRTGRYRITTCPLTVKVFSLDDRRPIHYSAHAARPLCSSTLLVQSARPLCSSTMLVHSARPLCSSTPFQIPANSLTALCPNRRRKRASQRAS